MKKFAVASMLACGVMAVSAGEVAGRLTEVQGSVTVSSEGALVKGVAGTTLTPASTILVASGARATVVLNDGCAIVLKANQHLTLNPKFTCSQQLASVTQLMTPYRVAQQGAPVGGAAAGGGAAGGGLAALAVGGAIVVSGALLLNEVSTSGN